MDDNKVQELLIQLVQDMSYVKAKLHNIDEQKLVSRIDLLEQQSTEHSKTIKSLENRNNTMESFVRNSMSETRKTQTGIFISLGLAIFSAVLNFII
jgi:hypothetical protein